MRFVIGIATYQAEICEHLNRWNHLWFFASVLF